MGILRDLAKLLNVYLVTSSGPSAVSNSGFQSGNGKKSFTCSFGAGPFEPEKP